MSLGKRTQACLPARVTPLSFDPRAMAARRVCGEWQKEPMMVALPPRVGDVPWPARLLPAAGSGSEANASGEESPPFQALSRTRRRRQQRKYRNAVRQQGQPAHPQGTSEAGPARGAAEQPAAPASAASGPRCGAAPTWRASL